MMKPEKVHGYEAGRDVYRVFFNIPIPTARSAKRLRRRTVTTFSSGAVPIRPKKVMMSITESRITAYCG
jgi:hypothetical protein